MVYEVTGRLPYRDHRPGTQFEAVLAPDVERRAIGRGAIRIVERSVPSLRPGSFTFAAGWDPTMKEHHHDG